MQSALTAFVQDGQRIASVLVFLLYPVGVIAGLTLLARQPQNTRRGVRNYRRRIVGIRGDRKALTAGGAR